MTPEEALAEVERLRRPPPSPFAEAMFEIVDDLDVSEAREMLDWLVLMASYFGSLRGAAPVVWEMAGEWGASSSLAVAWRKAARFMEGCA